MSFVHLHTHTEYSLLDGANKITDYVARVKELGMTAAAITDHGAMYGVINFYKECTKQGIRPIIGCEVYVAPDSRFNKDSRQGEDRYYHLVLIAENNTGYSNLMKIVSRGYTEGYYFKPRVDFDLLQEYHEGLIALSACLAGEIPRLIERGLIEEARKVAVRYDECFGRGNFFLEIQDHGLPAQREVNMTLVRFSRETGIPLVATNDIHYTYAEDADAHDILLCLQTQKTVSDPNRMRYDGGQYYVKSEEDMRGLFPYAPEAIDHTQEIADRCLVEIEFGRTKLPHYECPDGLDSWTYLNRLCASGFSERYGNTDPVSQLHSRLAYELDVIRKMGYVDYFLIVWDFINYAREHDIPVGPGRGSAAGSMVAYCLHITNIDPVRYNLIFERFLNPERVSMPDIDVDICFERRREVIDYVTRRYGADRVVQIVTFGTFAAKGVIRDVGRAMDLPYSFTDAIAKMVPRDLGITIDQALDASAELRSMYETDPRVTELIDMSKRLEGLPRHASTHAAGVVICSEPAENLVPLALSPGGDNAVTTQFNMIEIEELGLLKMDFLGLRTLTVIKDAVDAVRRNYDVAIDFDRCAYDDIGVYRLMGSGDTAGIFQLESPGMTSFFKQLQPHGLEDVIAGISLYRPGPMDMIPQYLACKNDPAQVHYLCKELEPILSPTYGCIVYQEQVMQIVRDLGGYTLGRSDLVRRAMSKKKQSVMDAERHNFIYGNEEEGVPGCIARGIDEQTAAAVYDEMIDFAKYGFNKSHAACYAVVAYETAYLRLHYPKEFMAALLTSVIDFPPKVARYIAVCRQMGIAIAPPDVNTGTGKFTVENGTIRYALLAVKSVGEPVVEAIVAARSNGPFTSLEDFLERIADTGINKGAVDSLIKAGALDSFCANRKQAVFGYETIMDDIAKRRKHGYAGQFSLVDFGNADEFKAPLPDVEDYTKPQRLSLEKSVLGIYVSGHPLDDYVEALNRYANAHAGDFTVDDDGLCKLEDKRMVIVGGIVTAVTTKLTRKNDMMAFVTLEDFTGSVETLVFPKSYEQYRQVIHEDAKLFIRGRVSIEEGKDAKLLCDAIKVMPKA